MIEDGMKPGAHRRGDRRACGGRRLVRSARWQRVSRYAVTGVLALGLGFGGFMASALHARGAAAHGGTNAADGTVRLTLVPDLAHPGPVFEGWGTALAWFAHVTGGWPQAERTQLADWLFGHDGLAFTIARYNIGGGNAPDIKPYLRPGAAVPGFWAQPEGTSGRDWWKPDDPAMWNWDADARQRWWLDAIKARVRQPILEAFSNSPPWFMTVSGRVSGAEKGSEDNLRPGFEGKFAAYLVRVTQELEKRHGVRFRTLSPVNEPNTDYWFAANTQEGAHWSPARQAQMIDALDAEKKARGLDVAIAAPDETSSQLFIGDWAGYPAATRARIGQLNVHSYGNIHQTAVRDIARTSGIRLWMSENDTPMPGDPEDFGAMTSPLAFAEHVVGDIRRLEPSAWVFWQAVETLSARGGGGGSNWGLIKADLGAPDEGEHGIRLTRKYWVMAQFSRYMAPGYSLVRVNDADTVGALSPDRDRLVLVHVNAGPALRKLDVPHGWHVQRVVTDAGHEAACVAGTDAPPRSVVTLILTRRPADGTCSW